MPHLYNTALLIGAALSAIAALLHIWVIAAGPRGYRLCGAGDRFIKAAEAGKVPGRCHRRYRAGAVYLVAVCAFRRGPDRAPLPLLRPALFIITFIYLLRGVAGLRPARYRPQPALYRRQLADLPRLRAGASAGDDAALGALA